MIGVFQIRKHCVFDFERQLSLNDARKRKKPDIIGRFLCLGGADGKRKARPSKTIWDKPGRNRKKQHNFRIPSRLQSLP